MNIRKIITFAFVFAIVALIVGLSGCERAAQMVPDKTEMPPMPDEGIPIGMAVALTGPFAEPYGLPMQRGFELAREEINMLSDANLMFVPMDTHSTVEGAVAAVQGLVDQGVPAIVGVAISTQLEQAFPIAQENGVVAFSSISSKLAWRLYLPRRSRHKSTESRWRNRVAGATRLYESGGDI